MTNVTAVDQNGTRTGAGLVAACRAGNQAQAATDAMFASGTPQVVAEATTAQVTSAVLVSADDHYWARCFVNDYANAEFRSGMSVFDSTKTDKDVTYSAGPTCLDLDGGARPPCATFKVDYVDRLPASVASVQFLTIDNKTTRVDTVNGFVFFHYVADVPDGVSTTDDGLDAPSWLTRVSYLDAADNVLAAQNLGTTKETEMQVADQPLLKAYPALRQSGVGITGDNPTTFPLPRQLQLATDAVKTNPLTTGHTISSATATVEHGRPTGTQFNSGQNCHSATLLKILVVGDFADVPHSDRAPNPNLTGETGDGPITAVELTIDGESGAQCNISVRTGDVVPPPSSTPLDVG